MCIFPNGPLRAPNKAQVVNCPFLTHLKLIPSQNHHWLPRYVYITKWALRAPNMAQVVNGPLLTHLQLILSQNYDWLLRYVYITKWALSGP